MHVAGRPLELRGYLEPALTIAHALRLAVAAAPALPGPASRARAAAPYCGSGADTLPRAPRGLRLMVIAAAFGAPNRRPNDQTQAD